jgi:ATP-binding protein involved in chromosome partitioning
MKIDRKNVLKALEQITVPGEGVNMVESGAIQNVLTFGDEVVVEISITNPAMQARKKVESEITNCIKQTISEDAKVKVNVKVVASDKAEVKGKQLPGMRNIIAISSGKGGVGKSTVTANVAISLSKMGFKVGILDADVYGPSIPMMFDVEDARPLAETIDGKSKMKPVENYGVKILSIGFFTKPDQAVIWRGPMAAKALNQLIFDAAWGELDFLLLDLPPGTGDIHLSIMQALPITGAVIVSTPQNIALADARKGVSMFNQEGINVPVLGMIENMAYFTPDELPDNKYYLFGEGGARNLSKDLNIPFLGELPIVQSIREAGDIGRPAAMQEGTPVEQAITDITRNIVTQVIKRNDNLPATEIIKITTMAGCSPVKK